MEYGYVRVSSADQNEDRQMIAMSEAGIPDGQIFIDKVSGKDFNRKEYTKMISTLEKGDTVFVKSIDRLGRDYRAIINEWNNITKNIGADIVVIDMPLLDTRKGKDLIGTLISDIVLQLLSYVAQTERENIKQRQAEGISAAKLRGVHLGRKPSPLPDNFHEILAKWEIGEISGAEAARACNMPLSSFRYRAQRRGNAQNRTGRRNNE